MYTDGRDELYKGLSLSEAAQVVQCVFFATATTLILGETMKESPKAQSVELSRRSLLRNAAFAAGGVAEAQTKVAQTAVGYQDTPKGAQQCDNCSQWQPPSSCKVVAGTIKPTGWCRFYVKKPAG